VLFRSLREEAREARAQLHRLIDFDSLPKATLDFADLERRLKALVLPDAPVSRDDLARKVLGDRTMFVNGERDKLASRTESLNNEEIGSILEAIMKSRAADVERYSEAAVSWFSKRLASGQLRSLRDAEDWNRAFHQAEGKKCCQMMVDSLPREFGATLSDKTFAQIKEVLNPSSDDSAEHWFYWGYDLHIRLARFVEAESAYREAIKRGPEYFILWNNLGNVLHNHLHRYDEAEAAYRQAILCNPTTALPWINLGILLQDHLNRYGDAETAYREAIKCDPKTAKPWLGLAYLLKNHLHRFIEAEHALREAIALAPRNAATWNNLGNLLQDHFGRFDEAECAYREAIANDAGDAVSWCNLGNLLLQKLRRYDEAEEAYREAIRRDSTDFKPWTGLGNLLALHLQRYSEAEHAYREAIKLAPESAIPWNNLGNLLQDHLQRYSEAEIAYREAIARDKNYASPWNGLGNLYVDHFDRLQDAMSAFETALRLDPNNGITLQNLIFLRRDFLGEGSAVRFLMEALNALPNHEFVDTTHLHEALFAAYDANWGLACEALSKALAIPENSLSTNTADWMRASAVAIHLNYGAQLLDFLDKRGDTARLRPWVEALRALHVGDRRALQNIASEIRSTAETIFDAIERRLKKLPEKTRRRPQPKPKTRRTRARG